MSMPKIDELSISIATQSALQQFYHVANVCRRLPTEIPSFDPTKNPVDANILSTLTYLMKTYETFHGFYNLDSSSSIILQYFDKIFILIGMKANQQGAAAITKDMQMWRLHQILCRLAHLNADFTFEVAIANGNWVNILDVIYRGFASIYVIQKIGDILVNDIAVKRPEVFGENELVITRSVILGVLMKFQKVFTVFNELSATVESITEDTTTASDNNGLQVLSFDAIDFVQMLHEVNDETFQEITSYAKKFGPILVSGMSQGGGSMAGAVMSCLGGGKPSGGEKPASNPFDNLFGGSTAAATSPPVAPVMTPQTMGMFSAFMSAMGNGGPTDDCGSSMND